MIRRFLCAVGWHKWLIAEGMNESEIEDELMKESHPNFGGRMEHVTLSYFYRKVCACCPTIKDEIEEYKQRRRTEKKVALEKPNTAKARYAEVKKHQLELNQGIRLE
jgi:hypothetical protein